MQEGIHTRTHHFHFKHEVVDTDKDRCQKSKSRGLGELFAQYKTTA